MRLNETVAASSKQRAVTLTNRWCYHKTWKVDGTTNHVML